MELFGQGTQRLGQKPDGIDLDAEFPGSGPEYHSLSTNNVPDVPLLERLVVPSLWQAVPGNVQLDLARHVLNMTETCLAHDPAGHHSARNPHPHCIGIQALPILVIMIGVYLLGQCIPAKIGWKSLARLAFQTKFRAPLFDLFLFVLV